MANPEWTEPGEWSGCSLVKQLEAAWGESRVGDFVHLTPELVRDVIDALPVTGPMADDELPFLRRAVNDQPGTGLGWPAVARLLARLAVAEDSRASSALSALSARPGALEEAARVADEVADGEHCMVRLALQNPKRAAPGQAEQHRTRALVAEVVAERIRALAATQAKATGK